MTKIIFTTSAYFPFQFCTFVVLQSLVGRIGNLGNGDQLGKNNPDDAKEPHDQPSDHHVPPEQVEGEAGDDQAVADEEDEEACLAPRVVHLPVLGTKAACSQEILLGLQSQHDSKHL